ncbi:MAG TPA: isoprenylcysteine carboxylmethyltransferase family protein [Longimicrobiales bacterium]|nr:isoprenylcysteine carboxylmethyltransferase family protein [Longimicrobiales bacterium]
MIRLALFVVATLVLAWVSRRSLRDPTSHGFPRFFAWVAIVALVLLNFRGPGPWFADPFSPRQIASWTLLFGSLFLLVSAVALLRSQGRPGTKTREGEALYAFEKTKELVTTGVYAYVRHPMYASLLGLAWGVFLKRPSVAALGLAALASGCLWLTARAEEAEDVAFFGDAYRDYMRRTRRFVPWVL